MASYSEILKSINLEAIALSSDMDSNTINRNYKLRQVAIFNALREANPHLTAKELASQMGTSASTLQRIRKDINMKSPYRYDKIIQKHNGTKQSNEQEPHTVKISEQKVTIRNDVPQIKKGRPRKDNNNQVAGDIDNDVDELLKNAGGRFA